MPWKSWSNSIGICSNWKPVKAVENYLLNFEVKTKPLPQPRPRFATIAGHPRVYTPNNVMGRSFNLYKKEIVAAAVKAGAEAVVVPLEAQIRCRMTPPRSLLRKDGTLKSSARTYPIAQRDGDGDNFLKAVLDSLLGIAFKDDSQFVGLSVTKEWALDSEEGIHVTIREVGLA